MWEGIWQRWPYYGETSLNFDSKFEHKALSGHGDSSSKWIHKCLSPGCEGDFLSYYFKLNIKKPILKHHILLMYARMADHKLNL